MQAHCGMLEVRRAEVQARLSALQSKVQASQDAMAARKEKEVTPEALASQVTTYLVINFKISNSIQSAMNVVPAPEY